MREGYTFDGQAGSAMLLAAQIRAGQVFPIQMQAWMERHPLAIDIPAKPRRVRNRQAPRPEIPVSQIRYFRGVDIAERVCLKAGVEVSAVIGRGRSAGLVCVRRRVVKVLRRLGFSWNSIGRVLDRDHATIMQYIKPRTFARTQGGSVVHVR